MAASGTPSWSSSLARRKWAGGQFCVAADGRLAILARPRLVAQVQPRHGPAVVGDGKVRLEPDGLGKIVQGGAVIVERAVSVAAVQVRERQLGGLPHRLVEIAEGLAVQSQPRADHPAGIERFHVARRHPQRLVAVEHGLGQAVLDGVDVGAAESRPSTHSGSSSIAFSQSARAPAKSSRRIRTDAREAYDSA